MSPEVAQLQKDLAQARREWGNPGGGPGAPSPNADRLAYL